MKNILKITFTFLFLCISILFSSCIPACLGFAYVDYENLDSNLNAPAVDKKLAEALEKEYYETTVEAISDGANINKTVTSIISPLGEHDYSPISKCISNGNIRLATLLLENGADPNYNNENCSLLVYAIQEKQYDIATELINGGADVNYTFFQDDCEETPLSVFIRNSGEEYDSFASFSSQEKLFNALLGDGAVIAQATLNKIMNNTGSELYDLHYIQKIVKQGDYSISSPLIEIISGENDSALSYLNGITSLDTELKSSLIIYATAFCNSAVIDKLIDLGCDINTVADEINLMSIAARYNSPEVVEYLFNNGIELLVGGDSFKYADYSSVLNENSATVKYIEGLKHKSNYEALSFACLSGNTEYISLYDDYLRSLDNQEKQELLRLAAVDDSLDVIKLIKSSGLDNFSSITEYIGTLSDETLKYLLNDCKLSLNVIDENYTGVTPLRFAIVSGDLSRVKLLVEKGADVNNVYSDNRFYDDGAPIFTAIYEGTEEIAAYLIDNGANVEMKDEISFTPLMCSANIMSHNMASLLVDCGADKTVKNNDGNTALDIAKTNPITSDDEIMLELLSI